MNQIIKVQRPVPSASISGLYVILEAAFTIALLVVLLYKYKKCPLNVRVVSLHINFVWKKILKFLKTVFQHG
jgi:hypothetical protein